MDQKDFDINIAVIRKNLVGKTKEESLQQGENSYEEQIECLKEKILKFTFEKKEFCNGLFSMLMPSELFKDPMIVDNIVFFQSFSDSIILLIKVIESDQKINFAKIQTDYINQMRQSKQQTKIDMYDSKQVQFGTVYYFLAIHSMPGGGLCDFVIIFQTQKKMIFMDFNFNQNDYLFWKTILCKLSSTIQAERESNV